MSVILNLFLSFFTIIAWIWGGACAALILFSLIRLLMSFSSEKLVWVHYIAVGTISGLLPWSWLAARYFL